jgi:hypothetical protein
MRYPAAAGIVIVLLAGDAHPALAQFRGGLTTRPSAPVAAPQSPRAPLGVVPVWWHWHVTVPPDIATAAPPRVAADAPAGGLQLDVLPWSAQVYVDGVLVGRVEQFRGYYQHLALPAGPHTIAIVAARAAPRVFDVVIVPGKTITYRP